MDFSPLLIPVGLTILCFLGAALFCSWRYHTSYAVALGALRQEFVVSIRACVPKRKPTPPKLTLDMITDDICDYLNETQAFTNTAIKNSIKHVLSQYPQCSYSEPYVVHDHVWRLSMYIYSQLCTFEVEGEKWKKTKSQFRSS